MSIDFFNNVEVLKKAKELASKLTIKDTFVNFSEDFNFSNYDISLEESVIFALVCYCYENDKPFSISYIVSELGCGYSYPLIYNCLKDLEKKGFIYRQAYYKPIFAPKQKRENEIYMDVIKYLISNSKRYNEENIYINIIDALLSDIIDVEFCFGCKHFKGNDAESFCDMCGYKNDALCRNSLIERAKRGELKIKES